MLANGKEYCDCPKKKCIRHGNCPECIAHHKKSLPWCKREKKESLITRLFSK